jgi:hypothetical protein
MRIYEGSPRQNWEEVLRSIGAYADREVLKDLLLLELDGGFILQGLALPQSGVWSESSGSLAKRTYELTDEQIGQLIEEATALRGTAASSTPQTEIGNFQEQAMRVIGAYLDQHAPRDLFLFEQEGAFVLRLLTAAGGRSFGHQLVEFTRDDILAMIAEAPTQR